MEQTAVEWLIETFNKKQVQFINWPEDYFNEAKEMEKQQKGYSEEEVLKFGQWLSEFNNLDNESEYVIKELLEQFKNK
jgi:hypothetical protein